MNRKIILGKICFVVFALLFICVEKLHAQIDVVSTVKQKAKTDIRPKAKPATKKIDYTRKVTIVRVEKKSRKNYKKTTVARKNTKPIVKRIQVPLLAVQFRLVLVSPDGSEAEANPLASFTERDRLRLSIKANQAGFLYIIRQRSQDEDGEIIFPTSLVNNGSNLVAANTEYVLPFNCPKDVIPDPRDCSLTLFPADVSPQEYFTLIFTRDQLVDLPNDVKNTRVSLANLMSAGKIEPKTLVDLIEDSNQDLVSQMGDTPFAVRIINVNANDNEEIIETFVLNKMKR
ncbi:MAG TPA: hypothetical protein VGC76_19000 [Pyrinomonadaceae bacterium]